MFVIHFFENNIKVLTQLLREVPTVEENIKIKGRKGKVSTIKEMGDNHFNVYIIFERIAKPQQKVKENIKRK